MIFRDEGAASLEVSDRREAVAKCRSLPWPGVSWRKKDWGADVSKSLVLRYLEDAGRTEVGRLAFTVKVLWDVCVGAGVPLSSWCILLDEALYLLRGREAYLRDQSSLSRTTGSQDEECRSRSRCSRSIQVPVYEYWQRDGDEESNEDGGEVRPQPTSEP